MSDYLQTVTALGRSVERRYRQFRGLLRHIIPYEVRRAVVLRLRGVKPSIGRRAAPEAAFATQTVYAVSRAYDFICFPIIDWEFRFQRPQQLVTQFARAGHRTYYLRTTFQNHSPAPEVEQIAEGVFGVQLPGRAQLDL